MRIINNYFYFKNIQINASYFTNIQTNPFQKYTFKVNEIEEINIHLVFKKLKSKKHSFSLKRQKKHSFQKKPYYLLFIIYCNY